MARMHRTNNFSVAVHIITTITFLVSACLTLFEQSVMGSEVSSIIPACITGFSALLFMISTPFGNAFSLNDHKLIVILLQTVLFLATVLVNYVYLEPQSYTRALIPRYAWLLFLAPYTWIVLLVLVSFVVFKKTSRTTYVQEVPTQNNLAPTEKQLDDVVVSQDTVRARHPQSALLSYFRTSERGVKQAVLDMYHWEEPRMQAFENALNSSNAPFSSNTSEKVYIDGVELDTYGVLMDYAAQFNNANVQ
jgi:hypothetical protein